MNSDAFPQVLNHIKAERREDQRSLLTPLPRKRKTEEIEQNENNSQVKKKQAEKNG